MTTFQGLSAAAKGFKSRPMKCNTAGLKEGAIVIYDTTVSGQQCKAPTGAGNTGIAGVIVGQQPAAGTAVGDTVEVAYEGFVPVQIGAGLTVTVGDKLITGATDGSAKTRGATVTCDVIGICEETLTAGTNNDLATVRIQPQLIP